MSEFNVISNLDVMAEEDAQKLLSTVSHLFVEESTTESEVSIDSVQLMELTGGKATFLGVFGSALDKALAANDYGINRVFDAFTDDQLAYGQRMAEVGKLIRNGAPASSAMKHTGKKLMVRRQIMINSEVKIDELRGKSYVNYMYRDINVSTGSVGPWIAEGKTNRVSRKLKLYVDLENQVFYTRGNQGPVQVYLGDTSAYDTVHNAIAASGNIEAYHRVLNSFTEQQLDAIADDQQLLFLTTYAKMVQGK